MIIYTAPSLVVERESGGPACKERGAVACLDSGCPETEHFLICTRPAGHPDDVHVAMAWSDIVGVWRAS